MAQSVMGDPLPENKEDKSPEKSNGLSLSPPESPLKPFLDADVASILSKLSPLKSEGIVPSNESSANTQQDQDLKSTDCSATTAEKELDDGGVLENSDSNVPGKSSTALSEDKKPSSGKIQQNMDTNVPNGSTTLTKETESLDSKDASLDAESNVPIFCLTIREGTEASYEKGIETETIALDSYRDEKEIDSDDSSVSSDSSSDCSDSFLYEMRRSVTFIPAPKTYNVKPPEDSYGDLPPLEDLNINVDESEVQKIGRVEGIVDLEAVIRSGQGLKPLQLESVLFLSNQKPLGKVCDVYGPVKQPYYSVKFNSKEHLEKVGVEVGMEVFYAPDRTEITEYVFPEVLQRVKGSDASGKNDNEPDDENLDYSDDEKEKEARLRRRNLRRAAARRKARSPPKNLRQAAQRKEARCETDWTNQEEHSPGSSERNPNPFYSMNNVSPDRPNWTPHRSTTESSSYSNPPPRQQFHQGPSNFSHQPGNSYMPQHHAPTPPPARNFGRTDVSMYQSAPSPFQPPHSPFPDQSPFQPPSPLVALQIRTPPQGGPIPFPPPSPLPYYQQLPSQTMGYSQRFIQQQQQPPVGPPRPILLQQQNNVGPPRPILLQQQQNPVGPPRPISLQQQMHMFGQMTPLGPLSPAPIHLTYNSRSIASPPPSTAFPPASPNFSYFSHPFPSAPSPGGPNVSHQSFFQAPPSPGGMQVMPPMSPLSIQIPNNVRSPPPTMGTNGYSYQGNRNLLQQNIGSYNRQRY